MNNIFRLTLHYFILLKNILNHNIYMIIGSYGILAISIITVVISSQSSNLMLPVFENLLPPAWQEHSDINHILGTDQIGRDIFNYLLISYKTTLISTLKTVFYVTIIGLIINYLLFFIPLLRGLMSIIFRLIIAIPPLLSAIVVALFWDASADLILAIIGLAYLPKFVHNIHHQMIQEWHKTYITAHRLDGLSSSKILIWYIFPNIFPTYLTEIVILFTHIILALITLNFLKFGYQPDLFTLGTMMSDMLIIIDVNYWGFLACGFTIIITIFCMHMLNLGTQLIITNRGDS